MHDMDRVLKKLADAPLPVGLDHLEADVMRRLAASRVENAVAPSWGLAAISIALIVGIGIGASAPVASNGSVDSLAHTMSGANLAPSSLLAAS